MNVIIFINRFDLSGIHEQYRHDIARQAMQTQIGIYILFTLQSKSMNIMFMYIWIFAQWLYQ